MGQKKKPQAAPAGPRTSANPFRPAGDHYAPDATQKPASYHPNVSHNPVEAYRNNHPAQWGPPAPTPWGYNNHAPALPIAHGRRQNPQSKELAPHTTWSTQQNHGLSGPQTGVSLAMPQQTNIRPQAQSFQPGQRIDKSSRHSLRSSQSRPITSAVANHIVQSIETDAVPQHRTRQLPIRIAAPRDDRSRKATPRREPTPINTTIEPVPVPKASIAYMKRAQDVTEKLHSPRKLLVLLDLNGTLVYRHGSRRQFSVKRPGVDRLLEYLFGNHAVVIFTSATQRSAEKMAQELLTPQQYGQLITICAREHLGLKPEQFHNKVQVYKNLNTVWRAKEVRQSASEEGHLWDMTNTILIDDSVVKAKSHPHNLLQVPEFMHPEFNSKKAQKKWTDAEIKVMHSVEKKLEELKSCSNVACQIRKWQEGQDPFPGAVGERIDEGVLNAIQEEAVQVPQKSSDIAAKYPTPASIGQSDNGSSVDEEDGDYDPQQWQGVKLPTPSAEDSVDESRSRKDVAMRWKSKTPSSSKTMKSERVVNEVVRSPSPVTEKHFSWLSYGKET
ncbi:uncharacterized protein HMPREF1541_04389 [Cyphellophora europaea CBS 101466]|uniref:Mitochondrial import inner membrane translocase subunit TIM50 n=1 Tax=Cyphellophora europaea (strain CBS 101466) TaxID=1220924 RepID=W2RWN5_CYPE1|nr:uncharacterized protein HMPREF1541_04389 [Cyphellophora europaea CBS 101466]ETN40114.1 hypothetical protein HMPREF1541_04389 [Cyphellophora europaea CBS 101466]